MKTETDISYGVIPLRWTGSAWEVLLIHQYSHIGDNSYWVLPKGHAESNETPLQTATRELFEETGLRASELLAEPSFTLQYTFTFERTLIKKKVEFFIGIVTDPNCTFDGREVKEGGWYSLEAAAERLDYQATKQMFAQACVFIATLSAPRP